MTIMSSSAFFTALFLLAPTTAASAASSEVRNNLSATPLGTVQKAEDGGKKKFRARFSNSSAVAKVRESTSPTKTEPAPARALDSLSTAADPFAYRLTLACGYDRVRSIEGSADVTNCSYALTACQYRTPPSDKPLYYLWRKKKNPANSPWELVGDLCGTEAAPAAAAPPPVPTMGQIQEAFRRLPFSKPSVRVEPKGNVTLVNLATFYEATWPHDAGLQPGEVSQPVQLLSWSVEFRISSRSYTFRYGDGTSSGPVQEAGGGYPDGAIKHTYSKPIEAAQVTVDSQLTGEFRVNGGEWIDIDTVADLQNEPVTTLAVKESKARLYGN